ncbi:MAG: hypothetical protein U0414_21725 [Polyangiaceae bacterium]
MREGNFSALGASIGVATALLSVSVAETARADEPLPLPVVRSMMGPSFHVGQKPLVQFTLDATAGIVALAGRSSQIMFGGELGYTYDNIGLNAFNLMAEIGIGKELVAYVAYQPRMILGSLDGSFAGGMRNAVGGHFLFDLLDIELGHQFLASEGQLSQSVNLTFGTNPAAVVYAFARFLGSSWGR